MEFYNLVFMEYELRPDQSSCRCRRQNVDTGLGLERGAMCLQDVASNFDTDGFRAIMDWVDAERASPPARATSPRSRTACSPTTPAR